MKKVVGAKSGPPIGTERPANSDLVTHVSASIAVVRIQEIKATDGVKYWVLIRPHSGLCVPHTVAQNEIFFLPSYRSNATSAKARAPEWSRNIAKAVEEHWDDTEEPPEAVELKARLEDTDSDSKARPRNHPYLSLFAEGGQADDTMDADDFEALVTEITER